VEESQINKILWKGLLEVGYGLFGVVEARENS